MKPTPLNIVIATIIALILAIELPELLAGLILLFAIFNILRRLE